MFKKASVTATHVADAFRLRIQWAIEQLHDDFVYLLEVCTVRAAAAPHVHGAVDQQFDSVIVKARDTWISKDKRTDHVEHREVGDGHAIRRRDLRRVTAAWSQRDSAMVTVIHPCVLRRSKITVQSGMVAAELVEADGPLLELRENPVTRKCHHRGTDSSPSICRMICS
jgi:hypothetical protein